jgi:hypothetical protein
MKEENTYSNRLASMLIISSNISSQLASTTPTAFIARLQLLGCIMKQEVVKKTNNSLIHSIQSHSLNATDYIVPYKVLDFKQLFKNAESCHIHANIGSNQTCYASLNIINVMNC